MRLGPAPEQSPAIQRLLAEALARPSRALERRELLVEAAVGGAFLVVAAVLALRAPAGATAPTGETLLLIIGLVLGARVVFEVGSCYTMPVQLAFVPALFVVSPAFVPLIVGGGLLCARALDVARGSLRPSRLINALADSWFAVGPALVLVAAGSPAADSVSGLVLLAAFAAQLTGDFAASAVRERLHGGAALRDQLSESAWVYLIDALLSPMGFAIALAATIDPAAVALAWPVFLLLAVFAREREERLGSLLELSEAYRGTARVLGEVVGHDDAYTGFHIRGVAELAIEVASDLDLPPRSARLVEFGALLHDVGKIAIPNGIINKAGPLDELEWQVIKTHTIEGQRMLERIGGLMSSVGQVVRWSHERFDGAGYPDGLAGEEIPIEARIVFCCDAYHAMTTDRPYRRARSTSEAIVELRENAGTQFDPRVVEALIRRVESRRWSPATERGPEGHPTGGPIKNGSGQLNADG